MGQSNRSRYSTERRPRRTTWDRFSEGVQALRRTSVENDPVRMPVSDISFENLLDASISKEIAEQHFKAVMARNASTDLDICAANDAQHASGVHLAARWREFLNHYEHLRWQVQQAAAKPQQVAA